MRELKLKTRRHIEVQDLSHPLRVRELKLVKQPITHSLWSRTLYGCVNWNTILCFACCWRYVAPFTGAWIETGYQGQIPSYQRSHPLRVRELKRRDFGGWIVEWMSHPLRVRELKPPCSAAERWAMPSHPLRVRELKLDYPLIGDYLRTVAPFTGAWIETVRSLLKVHSSGVAPFTGAWIETENPFSHNSRIRVAPFTGAWIETALSL